MSYVILATRKEASYVIGLCLYSLPEKKPTRWVFRIKTWGINSDRYLAGSDELFGFAIAGHGLYTWGNTIQAAKRQDISFVS
ncbi:MAG: hypothetical protein RIE73_00955 [Coleofasciculus sp. C1-SOL-03]|uniref:hypothetical protein n=1 Tax=Coleofasciculus sp. C1-SOL-03 TaxID=3069522 RepID=UPI003300BDD3